MNWEAGDLAIYVHDDHPCVLEMDRPSTFVVMHVAIDNLFCDCGYESRQLYLQYKTNEIGQSCYVPAVSCRKITPPKQMNEEPAPSRELELV